MALPSPGDPCRCGHGTAPSSPSSCGFLSHARLACGEGFHLLVESVEDYAIFMLDPAGRIASWNVGAERIKGHRAGDILGRPFSLLYLEEDLAAGRPQRLLDEAEARGKAQDEGWRVRADGSRFYAHVLLTALRDRDGKLLGFGNVTRDITARRESDVQLREALDSLRRDETMSQLGSLVAGVAHEVRNPLFGISATLEAFEAQHGQRQDTARYVSMLRREVSRLNTLMHGLLTYGRPPSTELYPCTLSSVLHEAVDATAALVREREAHVEVRVEPGLPRVPMDPGRLAQVFQNLLANALQHSPCGASVRLTARRLPDDGEARIECVVGDEGPGFSPEDLPRVFEPFYTRRHGGVGLGLSIVQRIVEEHRGTVSVGNAPEGGAEVRVCLPAGG
ncbi:sensor histidine kinase [Archangium sp.]|uniref:sensor histidine kinase n=1 Tax=Archangium sp. TaxID=1872627 RepID=UPI002D59264A|nr:ATP-binding protein [Archangium sp.]HYO56154.1 ATP-binding protein [Archangium sp.]